MAEYHLASIRQVQSHGPYFLIGYSLGGLVMLEIARRLSGDGEKTALLVMLDSYPHRSHLSFGQQARLALRLAKRRALSFIRTRLMSVELAAQAMQRVSEYQDRAWLNYRPQFYDGKIKFVRAAVPSFVPDDPVDCWAHLARELKVETVPGNHLEMLTTQVESLASTVARYIEEALGE